MKNLIIILLLIPMLAFAWGTDKRTAVPVTGTLTTTIDSLDTRKLISVDVLPAITGTVTADVDSTKQRKLLSIDVLPAITGAVTVNTEDSVTLSNPAPAFRDSIAAVELTAEDTVEVDMTTGVVFGNLNGVLRVGLIAVDDTRDSTIIQYRFRHGTFDLSTRWMPLYVDTTRTDGEASSIASSCGINEYVGNKVYWSVLYDPSDTNPMGCTPIAGDVLQIRLIRLGDEDETLSYITLFTWGTN